MHVAVHKPWHVDASAPVQLLTPGIFFLQAFGCVDALYPSILYEDAFPLDQFKIFIQVVAVPEQKIGFYFPIHVFLLSNAFMTPLTASWHPLPCILYGIGQ